jgi:hypothetical protein
VTEYIGERNIDDALAFINDELATTNGVKSAVADAGKAKRKTNRKKVKVLLGFFKVYLQKVIKTGPSSTLRPCAIAEDEAGSSSDTGSHAQSSSLDEVSAACVCTFTHEQTLNGQRVDDNGVTTDDERQIDTNDMRLYAPDDQDPATLLENRRSLDNSSFIEIKKKRQPMVAPSTQRAAVSARRSYDGNADMPLSPPYSTDVGVYAHVRLLALYRVDAVPVQRLISH